MRLAPLKYFALSLIVWSSLWSRADTPVIDIVLKDHTFHPNLVSVPPNIKVKLRITNKDSVTEEFDSFSLNREKVIFAKQSVIIFIGPLEPGRYEFFGEFHPNSARGVVEVKEHSNAD